MTLPTTVPTTRDTLLALAARCEAASGPDRELDAEIAEAYKDAADRLRVYLPVPRYSDSLDAALSLADLSGYVGIQRYSDGWYVTFCPHSAMADRAPGRSTQAKTAAGGACAAALRARAALA